MNNPLHDLIEMMVDNNRAAAFPIPRFALAVLITGNTREEIDSAVAQLEIDLAVDWRDRTEIDSVGGRSNTRLRETNPFQTPEGYEKELTAWGDARRAQKDTNHG